MRQYTHRAPECERQAEVHWPVSLLSSLKNRGGAETRKDRINLGPPHTRAHIYKSTHSFKNKSKEIVINVVKFLNI